MNHGTEIIDSAQVQPPAPVLLLAGVSNTKKSQVMNVHVLTRPMQSFQKHFHISQIFKLCGILNRVLSSKYKVHITNLAHIQCKFVLVFGEDEGWGSGPPVQHECLWLAASSF